MTDTSSQNTMRGTARKKAVEACERCRGKRIKCNGLQPCEQCMRRNADCVFAIAPLQALGGNDALAEKLDSVLARLENIEQRLDRQHDANPVYMNTQYSSVAATKPKLLPLHPQTRGIVKLNQQTGCFEYYGRTSTFQIASSLGKRFEQSEEVSGNTPVAKKRRIEVAQSPPDSPGTAPKTSDLDEVTSFCDYIVPPHGMHSNRRLHAQVADRHLGSFFHTIHVFLPILDEVRFRSRYSKLRKSFEESRPIATNSEDLGQPQSMCLLYAVLALGALYENDQADSSAWASWYFAEAQSMLGRLLDANNLALIQAATFLGAYAQHAIKPNLAYNLNGIAARLAYSLGLNVESLHQALGFDKQEARRTWAIIYIQEIELSLDAGRPMSIRSSDMNMNHPTVELPTTGESSTDAAQVIFIGKLANLSKIVRGILKISSVYEERPILHLEERESLRQQLGRWRDSLPNFLDIKVDDGDTLDGGTSDLNSIHGWRARQQSSLRIHFNLAKIILLRSTLSKQKDPDPAAESCPLMALHRRVCLDAARDMIAHIHRSFELAPTLRRWSYYCFYCLQATLVLLPQLTNDNHSDKLLCRLAVDIFERIELKASQRCADVVRQYLQKRTVVNRKRQQQTTTSSHDPPDQSREERSVTTIEVQPMHSQADSMFFTTTIESQNDGNTSTDMNAHETNATSSCGADDSNGSWPPISPDTLQNDMYGALYNIDGNDDLYLGHQPYFFSTESFTNDFVANDTSEWSQLWNL